MQKKRLPKLRLKVSKILLKLLLLFTITILLSYVLTSFLFVSFLDRMINENMEESIHRKSYDLAILLNHDFIIYNRTSIKTLVGVFHQKGHRILLTNSKGKILYDSWEIINNNWISYSEFLYSQKIQENPNLLLTPMIALQEILSREQANRTLPIDKTSLLVREDVYPGDELRLAVENKVGQSRRRQAGSGETIFFSSHQVGNRDFYTIVSGTASVAQFRLKILQNDSLNQFSLLFILTFLVLLAIAFTITRPLVRLKRHLVNLTTCNRKETKPFPYDTRKDEIGELSRSIHGLHKRMTDNLQETEFYAQDIAHELKNPLAAIRSAAEMMDINEDGDEKALIDIINRNILRSENLLNSLQEIAEINNHIRDEKRESFIVSVFLSELVAGYKLQYSHLEIKFKPPTSQSTAINLSKERLEQAIHSIIDNTADFASSFIRLSIIEQPNSVQIHIEDDGPGISASPPEQIFNRFYSSRTAAHGREASHNGLGLTITKAIIDGFDGTISVKNNAQGGACFIIKLNTF